MWVPVPRYERYEVSDEGLVRNKRTKRILKTGCRLGYRQVCLQIGHSIGVTCDVHRLVCEAFHGPRPAGMEVRHLDGRSLNNKASNLCWGTRIENVQDSIQHGTHHSYRRWK